MPPAQSEALEVWRFDLDRYPDADIALLDETERRRAAAFVFARDRDRYIAGRCLLRTVLGQRLGVEPANIELRASPSGKPYLPAPATLQFNLSHSHEVCYIALLEGTAVGIDVELDKAIDDPLLLGNTVFSPQEMDELNGTVSSARTAAFLRGWTRKESLVKAIGVGVGIDLKAITVGLGHGEIIVPPIAGVSAQPWRVRSLEGHPGEYVACAESPES